jgi:signal transduction histidine kinase
MRACVPPTHEAGVEVGAGVGSFTARFEAIHRALSNIVLNAVDATPAGGTVQMQVASATLHGRPAIQFTVVDSGSGIPADRIGEIWHPYVTSKPAGTGLGLAIARQAVVEHGGEVGASSDVGHGTRIRIILPLTF